MNIKIWISSFIPKNILNYTNLVPDGTGSTMIPGPLFTSDCFLTDQRSFSDNSSSSSRLRSTVEVDMTLRSLVSQNHHCDNTVEVDCEDGDIECDKTPDSAGLKVTNFVASETEVKFTFEGGAGNPCALGAPDIDWLVHVKLSKLNAELTVSILPGSVVEPFPAFEMYAQFNGETKQVFQRSPDSGATPWNLIGPPNKPISGSVSFS